LVLNTPKTFKCTIQILLVKFWLIYIFICLSICMCINVTFFFFFLAYIYEGISICYKWILFLIFHFGCDLFITLQKMDCLYVHSFDGQRCAFSLCHWNDIDDNFSICGNNFLINGCYISTSTIIGYKTKLEEK